MITSEQLPSNTHESSYEIVQPTVILWEHYAKAHQQVTFDVPDTRHHETLDASSALLMATDQVIDTLQTMAAAGNFNLTEMDVKFPIHYMNTSLLKAMARSIQNANQFSGIGGRASIIEVGPEITEATSNKHHTSLAALADGARKLAKAAPGYIYNTDSLTGLAAYMDMRRSDTTPTLYVTLLHGRTVFNDDQFNDLLATPGLAPEIPDVIRREIGSVLLSGFTAEGRGYTPLPDTHFLPDHQPYTPDQASIDEYYNQLEADFGISLARTSQFQR